MIYSLPFVIALLFLQTGGQSHDIEQMRHQASQAAEKHRQEALRLNDLAGHINTEADAETLVDAIAEMFADQLPPPWATREVRRRLARTEYAAATNPSELIPEERLALIWNQYAREIAASDETIVSATELHSLRDLEYSTAKLMWSEGWNQSIWTMPDVYALGPDGKVAGGCRALEALRMFYDLDNQFGNLRAVRKALEQGTSFADQIQRAKGWKSSLDASRTRVELEARVEDNPIRTAESRYISEHGVRAINSLLKRLLDQFLPE